MSKTLLEASSWLPSTHGAEEFRCSLIASIVRRPVERTERLRRAHVHLRVRLCGVRVASARVSFGLLATNIEPPGFLFGDPDDGGPRFALRGGALEKQVDFFEAARAGFRVEEVDGGDDEGVDDGVGSVGAVGDVGEHDGAGEDDAEVSEPVHGG